MSGTASDIQIANEVPQVLGKRARDDSVVVDVSKPIPYPISQEVAEVLRLRVLQLEDEVRALKKLKTLPAASGFDVRDLQAEAQTIKARSKSLFDLLKQAVKNEKYAGCARTVKVEDHFSQEDFELVFGNSGLLIQPTPDNKPKSNVWIRKYGNETDFSALFGDAYKVEELKGNIWSVGSISVGKGQKFVQTQLEIQQIKVHWSKNREKAVLKIEIAQKGFCGDFDPYDDCQATGRKI
ncbi:hypothetical protein BDW22DRAFT_1432445 [Trametopsis cervina]|nr:hypothetical protein BDW22DRAFT_1432445 [Trametopsis cervina]